MKLSRLQIGGIFVSLLIVRLFTACQKEATTTNNGSNNVVFSASIAGTSWNADSVWAVLQNDSCHSIKIMTITGYSASRQITLLLADSSKLSSDSTITDEDYLLTDSINSAIFTYLASPLALGTDTIWSTEGVGQSGQATVTAVDGSSKKVTGNFHFNAQVVTIDSTGVRIDTLSITNGQFKNISYQYIH
jgi:Family of unknown function (DUF6252)